MITQRITDTWPKTELFLIAQDDIDYAGIKERAIIQAAEDLYGGLGLVAPTGVDLDATDPVVQQLIADLAVLSMITVARDAYKDTARTRTLNGATQVVNTQEDLYDKLAFLDDLERALRSRIEARMGRAEVILGGVDPIILDEDVPMVSVAGRFLDPETRARERGPF